MGLVEVAELAGITIAAARALSYWGKLLEPGAKVSGRIPVWKGSVIEGWLADRQAAADAKATTG